MFKQRAVMALLLIPIVVGLILYANQWILMGCGLILFFIAAVEWSNLIPLKNHKEKGSFFLLLFLSLGVGAIFPRIIVFSDMILWCIISVLIIMYPRWKECWGSPVILIGMTSVFFAGLAAVLMVLVGYPGGRALLLYLLCLVWAADTGAYLLGKSFGRHRFIPAVSPGKSIEGLIGGVLAVGGVFFIKQSLSHDQNVKVLLFQAICVFIFSVIGDLAISMLKRRVAVKDTGQLIPGHGGLLDRIDSLFSAAPVFLGTAWFFRIM